MKFSVEIATLPKDGRPTSGSLTLPMVVEIMMSSSLVRVKI